jgi:hypothetical protein
MKKILDAFPAVLLLAFFFYLGINPISLGPIVGFVASSLLFAYQQYLFRTEQPDILGELEKLRKETDARVLHIQTKAETELTQLRDDVAKFSLTMARVPGVMERPKDKPKIQF